MYITIYKCLLAGLVVSRMVHIVGDHRNQPISTCLHKKWWFWTVVLMNKSVDVWRLFLAVEILYCWFLVKKRKKWWLYSLPLIGGSSTWFWSIQQLGFGYLIESLFCSMNSTVYLARGRGLPKQDHHAGLSQNKVPPAKLMVDHHLFHSNCCLFFVFLFNTGILVSTIFGQVWSRQKVFVKVAGCAMVTLQDLSYVVSIRCRCFLG